MSDLDHWTTRRLLADRLEPRHFLALLRTHQDARVMATLGGLRTHEQTRAYLRQNLAHWKRYGHGTWIFSDRRGRMVGRGGVRFLEVEGEGGAALSYAVASDLWVVELGTEIARGLVRIAFRGLGLRELIAVAYPGNVASRRVMEKAGLRFERETMHAGEAHVLYRILR